MKNIIKVLAGIFDGNAAVQKRKENPSGDELVLQIHNEFDSAEERLLQGADKVLKELGIITESQMEKHAELHKQLGFHNSKIAKEHSDINRKLTISKELAGLIHYYKQNYPIQKFLTEDELNRICEKYNLIYAPVGNYIENVPEKNLAEIANVRPIDKLHEQEDKYSVAVSFAGDSYTNKQMNSFFKNPIPVSAELAREITSRSLHWWPLCERLGYSGKEPTFQSGINHTIIKEDRQGLFIAAPKSHFDLDGVEMASKFGYASISRIVVRDPIVFRYCKGGIQVLSKWGLEASDPLVVNEKMN